MIRSPTLWRRRSCCGLLCLPATGLRGTPAKSARRFRCGTNNARTSIALARKRNQPVVSALMLNRNLHVALFDEPLKLLSPFDQQDALRGHQVVERQRVELALRVDAVKIDVIESHLRPAVFVDERKRWAGHIFGLSGLEPFSNTFDHGGLPCSQVTTQKHDASGLELGSESATEFRGLFGGMS